MWDVVYSVLMCTEYPTYLLVLYMHMCIVDMHDIQIIHVYVP